MGGFKPSENVIQVGVLFPIIPLYGKNVPNHQPDNQRTMMHKPNAPYGAGMFTIVEPKNHTNVVGKHICKYTMAGV